MYFVRLCCTVLWVWFSAIAARGGDWPQILGPQRNGLAENERLAATWPAGGPKLLWQRAVGEGYAGAAMARVSNNGQSRAFIFHREGDQELLECLESATGRQLWKTGFATSFKSQYSSDHGPRCVPLVHTDRVYVVGAGGNVHCVRAEDGKHVWSRAAFQEFQAPEGFFGAGSSPIVAGDKLLLNVGGARSMAGIVAFDLTTGKTAWQATDELASYSSPRLATIQGKLQAVFITRYHAMGIDPERGGVLWKIPFGARGPTVNAATPLILGDRVLLTASYNIGAVLARIPKQGEPTIEWQSDVLSSQYTTPILVEKHVYGIDGRDDVPGARLRCLDPLTGNVAWTQEGFGKGSLLLADGKLIALTTSGRLVLIQPDPKGYKQLASAQVLAGKTYALPALCDGLFIVRDDRQLKCFDLR